MRYRRRCIKSKTDYVKADLLADPWKIPSAISTSACSNTGAVSIGSVGQECRIVNLASGYKDTDAVNVVS